jgi:hypothetical protein
MDGMVTTGNWLLASGLELTLQDSGKHSHATRSAVLFVLIGFLVSFAFIRMSTRLMRSPRVPWWPGSVSTGGVHVHHLVFGIFMMLIGGTLGFALTSQSPWVQLSALVFGIGGGLTFDEFALWLHLEDVYWEEEGRQSVDATVVALIFIGIVVIGASPVAIDSSTPGLLVASVLAGLLELGTCFVAFLKKRFAHGYLGIVLWPLAAWAALRLAKPDSPWARRFYGERNPKKQARAEERFCDRRTDRVKDAFRDAIGGRPTALLEAARKPKD